MKKLLSIITAACLCTCGITYVGAESVDISMDELYEDVEDTIHVQIDKITGKEFINEPTPEMMEAMIKKVRPLIDVPEEFENFSWDFSAGSYYSRPSWRFYWTDNTTGEVSVRCDNDGNITSYRYSDFLSEYKALLPDKSPDELLSTATDFIKKTVPYTAKSELVLDSTHNASLYNHNYTYNFVRHENGIPVPDNTITVEVDHKTGRVMYLDCTYATGIGFAKGNKAITEDEAKKILSENQSMVLSYRLKTEYDDEGKLLSRKAYLIYTPEKGYISVDAQTGKVYLERNTWNTVTSGAAGGSSANKFMSMDTAVEESTAADEDGGYRLSEQELAQLEVLKNLISKDEAIKSVTENEYLYINPDATAVSARLDKLYREVRPLGSESEEDNGDKYAWSISFSVPYDEEKYSYSGMHASVDAQTGELISFSADTPDHYYYTENKLPVPEIAVSDEEAIETASNFIKLMQPEKAEKVRYSDSWQYNAIKYIESDIGNRTPVYGIKNLNFVRVNEGVDFTYNNFSVAVDLITGKITSYNYNWYEDVEFESPKDAISAEYALMSLYSYEGFGLNYEINSNFTYNKYLADEKRGEYIDYDSLYETSTYSRLVYSAYDLGTTTIRALDGKMINYSGEEYQENGGYSYNDIDSHWAKDTILRFSYAGIGFEEESFRPDEKITAKELYDLYSTCRLYGRDELDDTAESITRMDAVKYIISSLGYAKIACLENVFITNFADNLSLKSEDIGFAAIAKGFGLIEGDGASFRPYDTLTRAEALTLCENVITLEMLER